MAGVSGVGGRSKRNSQIFSNIVRGFDLDPNLALKGPRRPVTSAAAFVKYNLTMDPALIPAFHDALVVAQTGSVGEAARRLHKSASAVSQQIRRIEARFGVSLFE